MERFKGDRVDPGQRFSEVNVMLKYLDESTDLIDVKMRYRKRDGEVEWSVWLSGGPAHVATVRSTHAYLQGACDVVRQRDGLVDAQGR